MLIRDIYKTKLISKQHVLAVYSLDCASKILYKCILVTGYSLLGFELFQQVTIWMLKIGIVKLDFYCFYCSTMHV